MFHLEPTYLRYIYDGLLKGSIHPENAAELPEGLIGLYEEAFDERTSVVERQKLLQRFAIWALLKKEVSAAFVAEVLGETEDEIQDFISKYSAWFNSPESGKYQLYHERLKVYLLQKLSEKEIHELHEKLITRLERAIEEQKADEFEWYGLEFLGGHYPVNAMLNGDGSKLLAIAYDQYHWQRQLKFSKGYAWTKNALKEVMTWASKYNDDEVIECGLQMVDLHHQEQNAAPQIVALVAEGDFDVALKRIEQFGGKDKEGLQRKFILYMLCLMDLTLLDSKDKPFSKKGIEKLLKHLDEQLPMDHSILNWNDFFPSYLIFLLAEKWHEHNIQYDSLFQLTRNWESDWFTSIELHSNSQIDLFVQAANIISDSYCKSIKLSEIAKLSYEKLNAYKSEVLMNDALSICLTVEGGLKKNLLNKLVVSFISQNNYVKAINLLDEFNEPCQEKVSALSSIINYLIDINEIIKLKTLIIELHKLIEKIEDDYYQSLCKIDIIKIKTRLGEIDEAINITHSIEDNIRVKINALYQIIILSKSNTFYNQLINQIEDLIEQLDDDWERDVAYEESVESLIKLDDFQNCEKIINQVKDEYWRKSAILKLSNYYLFDKHAVEKSMKLLNDLPELSDVKFEGLINQINYSMANSEFKLAEQLLSEVWNATLLVDSDFDRNSVQRKLIEIRLFEKQNTNVSFLLLNQIGIEKGTLTNEFQKEVLFDLLNNNNDLHFKNSETIISEELLKNYVFNSIDSERKTLYNVNQLIEINRTTEVLSLIDNVEDLYFKSSLIRHLLSLIKLEDSIKIELINKLVFSTNQINNVYWKCHSMAENISVLQPIYSEDEINHFIKNLIALAMQSNDWLSVKLMALISAELYNVNKKKEAQVLLSQSLNLIELLNQEDKEKALLVISLAFTKQNNFKDAKLLLSNIKNNANKSADISYNSKCEALYLITEVCILKRELVLAKDFISQLENIYWKNKGYTIWIFHLIKTNKISESIQLSNSLPLSDFLRTIWKDIGKQKLISRLHLKDLREELIEYFMKGEIDSVNLSDLSTINSKQFIFQNKNKIDLLSQFLTKLVLYNLFYKGQRDELTYRIHHSLNIHWASELSQKLTN